MHVLSQFLALHQLVNNNNKTLQTIASYNASSVVLVFSMLSLGCILISDLVVANFFMPPGMILLYLATSFFMLKVLLHEIYIHIHISHYTMEFKYSVT